MKHPKRLVSIGLALAFAASSLPFVNQVHAASHQNAQITGKVGFLFSDFTTSARWQFDRSYFIAALHKLDPKVQVVVQDAKNDQTRQQTEATSLLTSGVKVLIDVPVDSIQAKAIVNAAHQNSPRVPVLAYDRLIEDSPVDAYASFNGYQVGVQQAKWLISKVAKGGTIVSIAGATTDNNAHLFHAGAFSVLQPLINNGTYKLGYDQYTPKWDNGVAQQEMASALNKLNNKVNGVLVANDGMAGGVIAALKAQGLAGKVPITGQDATVAGLQQILLGNQGMTVYKPIRELAQAAAHIVDIWLHGHKFNSGNKTPNGFGKINTAIRPVVTITKSNVSRVIKDGYASKSDVCKSIPASACAGL